MSVVNMSIVKRHSTLFPGLFCLALLGCAGAHKPVVPRNPSLDYAQRLQRDYDVSRTQGSGFSQSGAFISPAAREGESQRAQLRLVKDYPPEMRHGNQNDDRYAGSVTNIGPQIAGEQGYSVHRSSAADQRPYTGPLSIGNPGVSASLWQEGRGGNDLFRDDRAWLPGDLLTIMISETADAKGEADTETKSESTITAALEALFGFETAVAAKNPRLDPTSLINATSTNEFKGEGETTRKSSLTATISAMVVEVFPTGLLRIEGEKIVAVNREEQVMVISGIVRPRDITSSNQVDSSKIANMRIDYFGSGVVGEAQNGKWGSRLLQAIWPF